MLAQVLESAQSALGIGGVPRAGASGQDVVGTGFAPVHAAAFEAGAISVPQELPATRVGVSASLVVGLDESVVLWSAPAH